MKTEPTCLTSFILFVKDYGCSWILNPGCHELLARRFEGVEVVTKNLNYRFTVTWIYKLATKSRDRCNDLRLLRQCVSTHGNCLIPHTCLTLFVFDILFVDGEIFYLTIILFLECIHPEVSYIVPPNKTEKRAGILQAILPSSWGAIAQSDDLLMVHFDLSCF